MRFVLEHSSGAEEALKLVSKRTRASHLASEIRGVADSLPAGADRQRTCKE